ncbi:MAG: glycosyltransferase family 4 protein [Elusimicrobia bacterium]|nr:glycosyltransferase family 4 protein [Elusimicrobiota bacterium]
MREGVAMISQSFHPQVGGAERQALELSRALTELGVPVVVLTRRLPGSRPEETIHGVAVRRLPAWGGGLLNSAVFMTACLFWLLGHAEEYRAAHVHLAGSPALAAALAARWTGRPALVKLGGGRGIGELASSSRTLAGRMKLRLLRWLAPRFVVVTRDLVEELRQHGLGAAPVEVVPNGVDARRFAPPSREEKARLRKELGWPEAVSLIYVGRFAPEKQLPFFIEAFAPAARGAPRPAVWTVVGAGPEEARLRDAARRLGVAEGLRICATALDIEKFYAAADIFVLPSISEGLSNALLEAMASGLAVLASRVGGNADAIEDGKSGLLFDPRDGAELRSQLERLLRDPGLVESLGREARLEAQRRFSLSVVAQRYVQLYRAGAGGRGA